MLTLLNNVLLVSHFMQVLLFVYFMIKFATEVLISESALVTKFYFSWTINDVRTS